MLNLEPATRELGEMIWRIGDEQLAGPTPCSERTLGELLDHVDGLSLAFTMAAEKSVPGSGSQGPFADASRLGPDWRTRIPMRLEALANAWNDEQAWQGMTEAGGLSMPAEVAGTVALNEVVVHGWDVAVASGQPFRGEPSLLEAAYGFVESAVAENPRGAPGLFGPPVRVAPGAPLLDRLIGLTGRDPSWRQAP